ncbi:Isochorismatase family protein [Planktothrix serta PCC 8927]|uniref:Isochorismatase family protein n=1 Tax=Planktothrix serta PCC 8927 TaxID=671068 RepID=A0A7Z9BYL5_9CYAN|nr:cysteine hydrolase [Planktothrix serta]VXD23608.1 Isochorismatase family protein [Planktothrix serta PCC 8927]
MTVNFSHKWQPFALLLIDVQNDFWAPQIQEAFPEFPNNISRLLNFCRQEELEVIHLREVFEPDGSNWLPRYRLRERAICIRGTSGAEGLDCARELPGEKVFEKYTLDGCQNTQLIDYLQTRGKRFLLTAGLATSVCVLFTAASTAQLGFLTAMISDCCADYPESHALTLKRYLNYLLEVVTLEEIPSCLETWLSQIQQLETQINSVE